MADVTSVAATDDAAKRAWLARVLGTQALGGGTSSPQLTEASFKQVLAGSLAELKTARGLSASSPAAQTAATQLGQALAQMNAAASAKDFGTATTTLQTALTAARSLRSAQQTAPPAGTAQGSPPAGAVQSSPPTNAAQGSPSAGTAQSTPPAGQASTAQPSAAARQSTKANEEFIKFDAFYEAALQGTSGQFADAATAEKVARQVADKARNVSDQYIGQATHSDNPLDPPTDRDMDLNRFNKFLTDAIQGTASKYADPDKIVTEAAQIAMKAMKGPGKEFDKLKWDAAKLPQPMGADCQIVHGKVPGPPNHSLCGTHGHIIDTDSKMVIAHDLDEYKKMQADPQAQVSQPGKADDEFVKFDVFYEAALQGTSGRFPDPAAAEKMAREIADKARNASDDYIGKASHSDDPLAAPTDRDMDLNRFNKFLADAIQGTASNEKNATADAVVKAAAQIAMKALKGPGKEFDKLKWDAAKLPQPMGADCEIVHGKVAGPPNHSLCGTHGHIIDTDSKMVIVHDLDEYKKMQANPQAQVSQPGKADDEFVKFDVFYEAALQGTSGQFADAATAEKVARQVADKARNVSDDYIGKPSHSDNPLAAPTDRDMDLNQFNKFLTDAIQGTASKYADPDKIVKEAAQIAMKAMKGPRKEFDKLKWDETKLPHPMGADCEIVRGKVSGPPNHTLCGTHGHIIDTDSKMVIAHNLDEYKKMQADQQGAPR